MRHDFIIDKHLTTFYFEVHWTIFLLKNPLNNYFTIKFIGPRNSLENDFTVKFNVLLQNILEMFYNINALYNDFIIKIH